MTTPDCGALAGRCDEVLVFRGDNRGLPHDLDVLAPALADADHDEVAARDVIPVLDVRLPSALRGRSASSLDLIQFRRRRGP